MRTLKKLRRESYTTLIPTLQPKTALKNKTTLLHHCLPTKPIKILLPKMFPQLILPLKPLKTLI